MTANVVYRKSREVPLIREELNKTTHFLLTSIEIPVRFLVLRQNGFVNAYIDDAKNENFYANCLFLLFNPVEINSSYTEFDAFLRGLDNYVTDYDTGHNQIVYVFKVKDRWVNSLVKFKQSKYSEFDKDYINKFFTPSIRQHGNMVPNKYYQILVKDPEYKKKLEYYLSHLDGKELTLVEIPEENELASKINPVKEVYRFDE